LTNWITKLVASVSTACHDTVWLPVPLDHTVEDVGEVTVMPLTPAREASAKREASVKYIGAKSGAVIRNWSVCGRTSVYIRVIEHL
jgi:hypothetical protein